MPITQPGTIRSQLHRLDLLLKGMTNRSAMSTPSYGIRYGFRLLDATLPTGGPQLTEVGVDQLSEILTHFEQKARAGAMFEPTEFDVVVALFFRGHPSAMAIARAPALLHEARHSPKHWLVQQAVLPYTPPAKRAVSTFPLRLTPHTSAK